MAWCSRCRRLRSRRGDSKGVGGSAGDRQARSCGPLRSLAEARQRLQRYGHGVVYLLPQAANGCAAGAATPRALEVRREIAKQGPADLCAASPRLGSGYRGMAMAWCSRCRRLRTAAQQARRFQGRWRFGGRSPGKVLRTFAQLRRLSSGYRACRDACCGGRCVMMAARFFRKLPA